MLDKNIRDGKEKLLYPTNPVEEMTYGNMKVKDVFKSLLEEVANLKKEVEELSYVPINITSFNCNQSTVELGTIINSLTFNWGLEGSSPVSTYLNNTLLNNTLRSYTLDDLSLNSSTTYTLKVTDSKGTTKSRSMGVNFYNGVYYGASKVPSEINSTFILTLGKHLQSTRTSTFNLTMGSSEYAWFAIPTRYGIPTFNVGGFDGGFSIISTIQFTNSKGYTESYDVYCSDNANLGTNLFKVT